MKKILCAVLVLLMLAGLMVLVPSGTIVRAEIVTYAVDAKTVLPPQDTGYLSDWEYEDPSISVKIEKGRIYDTDYVVAHVKIANAGQMRSAYEGSLTNPYTMMGTTLARNVNAVFAINGDYFPGRSYKGHIVRQGKAATHYKCDGNYDVLLIDDAGDLHILRNAKEEDVAAFPGTVVNAYTFGPGLVIDGVRQSNFVDHKNAAFSEAQRMCLAQVGPLEYLCICSEGPEDPGSVGLTLEQFAELVSSFENVQNAYNLDGGSSSTMVFRVRNAKTGKLAYDKINSPNNPKRRPLYDILYFASAYQPD